jgi:ATP:ADP antiporter, AAA family
MIIHYNSNFLNLFPSPIYTFSSNIWQFFSIWQFPSPNEYSSFMGDFSTATGIATFTMMLLGRVIFRRFGWGVAAMITPTVLLLTGVGFFSLILFGQPITPLLASIGLTPLLAAVYVGALQNIFSKSAKYSLFDPCKEMAYIPLDEDMKVSTCAFFFVCVYKVHGCLHA